MSLPLLILRPVLKIFEILHDVPCLCEINSLDQYPLVAVGAQNTSNLLLLVLWLHFLEALGVVVIDVGVSCGRDFLADWTYLSLKFP